MIRPRFGELPAGGRAGEVVERGRDGRPDAIGCGLRCVRRDWLTAHLERERWAAVEADSRWQLASPVGASRSADRWRGRPG
jgi:hypothetical protein